MPYRLSGGGIRPHRLNERKQADTDSVLKDAAKGAVAGAIATKVMEKVAMGFWKIEGESVREREKQVREKPPCRVAAEKVAHATGMDLNEKQLKKLTLAFNWGLDVRAGAACGVMRKRVPGMDAGRGIAFGTGFFLTVDEGVNTAFGLTPPPQEFPWQAHARGLAAHATFGMVADSVLDGFDLVAARATS